MYEALMVLAGWRVGTAINSINELNRKTPYPEGQSAPGPYDGIIGILGLLLILLSPLILLVIVSCLFMIVKWSLILGGAIFVLWVAYRVVVAPVRLVLRLFKSTQPAV